jgi:hypothetical protein
MRALIVGNHKQAPRRPFVENPGEEPSKHLAISQAGYRPVPGTAGPTSCPPARSASRTSASLERLLDRGAVGHGGQPGQRDDVQGELGVLKVPAPDKRYEAQ